MRALPIVLATLALLLGSCAGLPPAKEIRARVAAETSDERPILAGWWAQHFSEYTDMPPFVSVVVGHDGYYEVMAKWYEGQPAMSHIQPPPKEIEKVDRGQLSQEELDTMLDLFERAKFHSQPTAQTIRPMKIIVEVIPVGGERRKEELKGRPNEELILRFSPKMRPHRVVTRLLSEKASSGTVYDPKGALGQLDGFFYELASRGQKPLAIPYRLHTE